MAARSLGKISLPQAVLPLKSALRDTDAAVRIAAAGSVMALLKEKSEKPQGHTKS
jgi:HEAT repeat protein